MEKYDVVIVGAGIIGSLIARELRKSELSVCVLEAQSDVAMGSTKANSAIVHAGFDAKPGTLKAKFNVKGSEMFEALCRDLGVKYIKNGALVVGFCQEDKERLQELLERGKQNGVKGLKLLNTRQEILKIESNIGKGAVCALYAPESAITCPFELCIAAMGNAMDNGAQLKLNYKVESLKQLSDSWIVNDEISAGAVINCAGLYSDEIARLAGDGSFSIIPRRGEYILLDRSEKDTASCTIFACPGPMGKGILVSPTTDYNIILGPTAENIEDKEDKSTTTEGQKLVKDKASEMVEKLNLRKTITSFTGLRAVGSSGDFIINKPMHGFINVAGIESPGLSSSPAIAVYVKELLCEELKEDGITVKENKSFNPVRKSAEYFKNLSPKEKDDFIKLYPEYGHIICRCESVTEGEIREAIRSNPKPYTLDGVKLRTRSQMGRCQGGFCSPYIAEMLAEELGEDLTKITKSGASSEILVSKTKLVR